MEQIPSLSQALVLIGASSTPVDSGCRVGQYLDSLDPEFKKESIALIDADSGYSADSLASAFKALGNPIGASTIRRHRIGACKCQNLSATH